MAADERPFYYPSQEEEEDSYDYYNMRNPPYYGQEPEGWAVSTFLQQKNNFALVVAIFVVGLFQFQGSIAKWYRTRVDLIRGRDVETSCLRLFLDVALGLVWTVLDYGRATYQILFETMRNCVRFGPALENSHQDSRGRNRCNSLPELEEAVDPSMGASDNGAFDLLQETITTLEEERIVETNRIPQQVMHERAWEWGPVSQEIEPAFLNEKDYPVDWMVYHAVLRVVAKTEADRYDLELAEKKQREEKQKQQPEQLIRCASSADAHAEEKKDDAGSESSAQVPTPASNSFVAANRLQPDGLGRNDSNSPGNLPILRSVVAA